MAKKSLEPYLWSLSTLFKMVYSVPVYQRPYSWGKDEIDVLLKDINEAYYRNEKGEGYYTGNIIIYDTDKSINGEIDCYDIIDGQQRITTFCLILMSVYSISISKGVPDDNRTLGNVKEALWKYLENKYHKEYRTVNLSSIEKKCFLEIYNECYDNPKKLYEFCDSYKVLSKFEERIINNLKIIYQNINNNFALLSSEDILSYSSFLLSYVQFIVIQANCKENKVFSMFESINSKGKHLDTIDIIKNYIFSKLDERSYSKYLEIWGKLILLTNDELEDYLYTYIKAYISFYKNKININNFKTISQKELIKFFGVTTECEALKLLLEDLLSKVEYYQMLSSVEKAYSIIQNNRFRFFYKVFVDNSYQHPKALFFRTLIEYKKDKIKKDDAVIIVYEVIAYMMKFLGISERASRDTIPMFSKIMNIVYEKKSVEKDVVVKCLAAEYIKQNISNEKLKTDLLTIDAYEKKKLTPAILALFESYNPSENGNGHIYYDKAFKLLNDYGSVFSIDHLLVQEPEKDSEFMYYKDKEYDILRLKDGHDFPSGMVADRMDYEIFEQRILNRLGNLRLYYKDKNSARQNDVVELKEYYDFTTFSKVEERGNEVAGIVLEHCLKAQEIDISELSANNHKTREDGLPRMDKMIEFGLVKPGDKLIITTKPNDSEATLIDGKYVQFKGKKTRIYDWGLQVTGWSSIRIYQYAAIAGENETLQDKRIAFIKAEK